MMGVFSMINKAKQAYAEAKPLDYKPMKCSICGDEAKYFAHSRAKIPGGWLVQAKESVTFVPDPEHIWDGGSLE